MGNTLQKYGRKENQKEPDEEPQSFTCEICIEPMVLPNKKFKNLNRCVHPFCTDCMVKYITVKLDDNIGNIPCPALNCEQILDPISCQNLVGPELFVKWCDVLCESAVLGLAQCYCPNRNCSELILDECGGDAKRSQCPNCKKLFCFQCKLLPWHAGFSCEECRELGDGNDVAFVVLAKGKNWKRCPQCRHFVELISGCHIVRCRCGADFCYKCAKLVNQHECGCDSAQVNQQIQHRHGCVSAFRFCSWILGCFAVILIFSPLLFLIGFPQNEK